MRDFSWSQTIIGMTVAAPIYVNLFVRNRLHVLGAFYIYESYNNLIMWFIGDIPERVSIESLKQIPYYRVLLIRLCADILHSCMVNLHHIGNFPIPFGETDIYLDLGEMCSNFLDDFSPPIIDNQIHLRTLPQVLQSLDHQVCFVCDRYMTLPHSHFILFNVAECTHLVCDGCMVNEG